MLAAEAVFEEFKAVRCVRRRVSALLRGVTPKGADPLPGLSAASSEVGRCAQSATLMLARIQGLPHSARLGAAVGALQSCCQAMSGEVKPGCVWCARV